ncbi:MAG TPA: hypothetical protein VFW52_00835 [Candidatus Saccharimonadales bacterium]|nr:hypothetical protein [Candidatus Saccharimonadales bacterium]
MVCLYCGGETHVTNSRRQKRSNQIWRRRQCKACRAVFTTLEAIDTPTTLIVDSGGVSEPFLPDKLYAALLTALQDRRDSYVAAREVTNTVVAQLLKLPQKPLFRTDQISLASAKVLENFDKQAYLRYVAEHPSLHR